MHNQLVLDPAIEARHKAEIAARKAVEEQHLAFAAETLSAHSYTALVDQGNLQVWRCAAPGTGIEGFDIILTTWGIAVIGDIPNLTFSVRLQGGLEFLAGKNVTTTIHRQLDHNCQEKVFDEAAFHGLIVEALCPGIVSHHDAAEKPVDLPDWVRSPKLRANPAKMFEALFDFAHSQYFACDVTADDHDYWASLHDFLDEARGASSVDAATSCFDRYRQDLGMHPDLLDIKLDKMAERLVRTLYLVNHAARAIVAQKAAALTAAVEVEQQEIAN